MSVFIPRTHSVSFGLRAREDFQIALCHLVAHSSVCVMPAAGGVTLCVRLMVSEEMMGPQWSARHASSGRWQADVGPVQNDVLKETSLIWQMEGWRWERTSGNQSPITKGLICFVGRGPWEVYFCLVCACGKQSME